MWIFLRSYKNKLNESVEVSDLHLDTAIKIKEELQKASPSRRTSWAKHRRMMEAEGFLDSENSEAYRQMIKAEQYSRGVMPTQKESVNLIADNKLQSIREEIGEIQSSKLEARQDFLRLNRLKREMNNDILIVEAVERALSAKDYSKPVEFNPVFRPEIKENYMIAVLTDIHYGAHVDVKGYKYNPEMVKPLLMDYADKILEQAEDNNVDEVYIMNLGDLVEHDKMRPQNTFNVTQTVEDQTINVTDIIIEFLLKLSGSVHVKYSCINGNHDRSTSNKNDNLYSASYVNLSNKIIETFVKYSKNTRIEFVETDPYDHVISKFGRNFLFVHGDRTPIKKKSVLAEQSVLRGIELDSLFAGHIHHYTADEVGNDKYVVTFGSIKGSDEYSIDVIGSTASRSQGVILVSESSYEIKQIKL